jgi:hypothetical protein
MADLKISALPAASVALAGTEVLPIVQSSATKQVTVANLTAGRAVATGALTVTGDATLSTGNIVPSTAAKGINFTANTPKAGMTSQLLNWYEEGIYTATLTPFTSGTITLNSTLDAVQYTRVGRLVTVSAQLQVQSVSSPVGTLVTMNIPFAIASLPELAGRFGFFMAYKGLPIFCNGSSGDTIIYLTLTAATIAALDNFHFTFSYVAA